MVVCFATKVRSRISSKRTLRNATKKGNFAVILTSYNCSNTNRKAWGINLGFITDDEIFNHVRDTGDFWIGIS